MGLIDDLRFLYNENYFSNRSQSVTLTENQEKESSVKQVEFLFSGDMVSIDNSLLLDSKDIYRKYANHKHNDVSFKRNCDGLFIVEKDGIKWLLLVELKSSFCDVAKKAIEQIGVSYIKIKSHLNSISSYNSEEYNELGIIISFPPDYIDYEDVNNNDYVVDNKLRNVESEPDFKHTYDKEFRKNKQITLEGKYFGLDSQSLAQSIALKKLTIKHVTVNENAATVNLDDYLK